MLKSFGERLKKVRIDRGLRQEDIGAIVHVGKSTVSQWENNIHVPDIETIVKIANHLNVTSDYLLGLSDVKTPIAGPTLDDEANELLEELHKRPEMKMLFSVSKKATKEDIEKTVKIIEALRGNDD